jgi:hypothetical protein
VKIEIVTMWVTDDEDSGYEVSRIRRDGSVCRKGVYAIRNSNDDDDDADKAMEIVVVADGVRGILRAIEAADTGVLLDDKASDGH